MTREDGKRTRETKTQNYGYKDSARHGEMVARAVANCRDIETASQLWRATTIFAATLPKQTCFNELLELGRDAVLAKRRAQAGLVKSPAGGAVAERPPDATRDDSALA